ncbi:LysE family translocator [Vibrio sonorensis]|uniref:LysE family translocator n=1 Tax=Vibrio sonorensis TaxID=1004316 RepID=UPI0008D90445|nr:LysE family translocator [Vibrio sonorensis]
MEFQALMLFLIASLSINLIPGPDVIYIMSNSMKGKTSSGIKAALGLGLGYVFHTLAAVFGLSALVLSSALAFSIVKYLGAAYLVYLAVIALNNARKGNSSLPNLEHSKQSDNVFRQGVIVSVLNPKVALFFMSFLPQFVDVNAGQTTWQLMVLGSVFCLLATLCNLIYAAAGSWLFSHPKASQYSRRFEAFSGVLLLGLAGKIAFSRSQ